MRIPTKKLHAFIWIELHVIYGIEVSETSKKNTKTTWIKKTHTAMIHAYYKGILYEDDSTSTRFIFTINLHYINILYSINFLCRINTLINIFKIKIWIWWLKQLEENDIKIIYLGIIQ